MQSKLNMQLEGLRGVTIVVIVLYHVFCRYLQIYCENDIWFMNRWGRIGVAIFLVISGYLMGVKPHKKNNNSWLNYIVSKFVRLWPCYIVSITFIFVITNIFYLPQRTVSLFEYFINICFINGYIGIPYVDGAHWYLTVLLSAHIVYGMIRKFDEKHILYVCTGWMIIIGLLHVLQLGIFEMVLGGSYVGYICAGIALGKLTKLKKEGLKNVLLLVESLFFVYALMGIKDFFELLFILLLVSAVAFEKFKLLENSVFIYLGKISYPLYLIHQNIAYLIIYYMSVYFGEYNYWFSIISIGIVLLLAVILYNFVERPIQAFIGSKLYRKRTEKDSV